MSDSVQNSDTEGISPIEIIQGIEEEIVHNMLIVHRIPTLTAHGSLREERQFKSRKTTKGARGWKGVAKSMKACWEDRWVLKKGLYIQLTGFSATIYLSAVIEYFTDEER